MTHDDAPFGRVLNRHGERNESKLVSLFLCLRALIKFLMKGNFTKSKCLDIGIMRARPIVATEIEQVDLS